MMRFLIAILTVSLAAATAHADAARPALTVAVTPFDVQGSPGNDWLGRAIQEGLATGLQKSSGFSGVIVPGIAPPDAGGAVTAAKPANSDFVAFGSVQIVDGQIRILGQIISLATGKSIGTLRCDASEEQLFDAEDRLAAQAQRILTATIPTNRKAATTPAPSLQLVGPTVATTGPHYFQGDVMSQITPPARNQDDYDRYYYYTGDTAACGALYGAPFACYGGCGVCAFGAPAVLPIATPISGW
jgi:TolB-like protein